MEKFFSTLPDCRTLPAPHLQRAFLLGIVLKDLGFFIVCQAPTLLLLVLLILMGLIFRVRRAAFAPRPLFRAIANGAHYSDFRVSMPQ
ncbi:MAG: hypothetical protein ACI87W_001991 [Halieaceae bacterium]|jgi:hypothetical protein